MFSAQKQIDLCRLFSVNPQGYFSILLMTNRKEPDLHCSMDYKWQYNKWPIQPVLKTDIL